MTGSITSSPAPGVTRVEHLDVTALLSQASREDRAIFVLPFRGVVDRATLMAALQATLPLEPPWGGCARWDALSDCLWEGLFQHPARRQLIVWAGAGACASGEMPLKRTFELNTFSIVLGARLGGADIRNVVSDSPEDEALVTFAELTRALDGAT